MTVLADSEIRRQMSQGKLVLSADQSRAKECSYSFLPGRAFLAGSTDAPIDFPGSAGNARVIVEPGKMIWIRTREKVSIPDTMVGFWWQTNSLSREGLMLVNMSMVEPGYEGDLACLFVNFGKGKVLIEADTVIAKMVFVNIEGAVAAPFVGKTSTGDYDTKLNKLALEQPGSFLQVAELSGALKDERDASVATIRSVANDLRGEADKDLKKAREDAVSDFKKDIPGTLRGSFVWALGLFAVLTLANGAVAWMKGEFFPDVKEIARSEAEKTLREQTIITEAPSSAQTSALLHRIDELNKRIDALDKSKRR